ncbi:MAG: rod shape-determining protein MreC [Lachnospiraceae bacterium]|nr:rod shape-determining protein MreC [Lachnospiraceae bacterium]
MRGKKNFELTPKSLLIIFTALCAILLGISAAAGDKQTPLSNISSSIIMPMQKGINGIGNWVIDKFSAFENIRDLQEENEKLSQKVNELTMQNRTLQQDRYELDRLRELYQLSEKYSDYPTVGARVIGKGAGNWFRVFLIDKGSDDGIKVNMNVIADGALVGIVTETGDNWSKVKTIIDDTSSVSAMFLETQDTCMVKGNQESIEDGYIDVEHISKDSKVKEGAELVTSNISSKYLEGISIGHVSDIKLDNTKLTKTAKVTPVVDFKHLQEVLVITELKEVPDISNE